RQLSRYGRSRVRLARKYPETRSWKSLAPAFFVVLLLLVATVAIVSPLARAVWLFMAGSYLTILCLYSLGIAWRSRAGWATPWLPVVFATIHLGAGAGILLEWLFPARKRNPAATA